MMVFNHQMTSCILIQFGLASCSEYSAPNYPVHLVVTCCAVVHLCARRKIYLLMNRTLFNGKNCQIYIILTIHLGTIYNYLAC